MHRIKISFTAVLFLLFLLAAFAWAQEPQREETKPPQQEEPGARPPRDAAPPHQAAHDEARPPRQQEEMKPPQQQEQMKPPRQEKPEKQEGAKPPKDEARPAHEQRGQEKPGQQAQQRQRPARGQGRRIPEEKFRASFGRQHTFTVNRVINQTTIMPGQTQFVYVGYTFVFLDPWPAEWAFTDDCYVDYVDDDYYLFDVLHPGIRVALLVVG
jgi:hypothetical protein